MAYDPQARLFAVGDRAYRLRDIDLNHALAARATVEGLAAEARTRGEGDTTTAAQARAEAAALVSDLRASIAGANYANAAQVAAALLGKLDLAGDASAATLLFAGGTSRRSLAARAAEMPRVTDYGAVGDEATDDTAAFRAAIAANPRKRILVPRGRWRITGALTLDQSQILAAENPRASRVIVAGSGYDAVRLTSDYAGVAGLGFTSAGRTSGAYVSLPNAGGTRGNAVRDCEMVNPFVGVHIAGNSVVTFIDNIEMLGIKGGTGVGIWVQGGNDTFIRGIVMDNPPLDQPRAGVLIQKSGAVWMIDSDIIHSGVALDISPSAPGDHVSWCFFSQVALDTSVSGLRIAPAAGLEVWGITFTGCWTASMSTYGVFVGGGGGTVDGLQFVGHRSVNNGQSGFALGDPNVVNTLFSACVAAGNSAASLGTFSGFDIGAGVRRFQITDCISGDALGFAPIQNRGILVNPGPSSDYVITGNNLLGNATALLNGATGAGIVSGNLGANTVQVVNPGPSPWNFIARQSGQLAISGGTINGLTLVAGRNRAVVPLNAAVGLVAVGAGDEVSINYAQAPNLRFIAT